MSEAFIFVFGVFVTLLAVGPLIYAAVLDSREDKSNTQKELKQE